MDVTGAVSSSDLQILRWSMAVAIDTVMETYPCGARFFVTEDIFAFRSIDGTMIDLHCFTPSDTPITADNSEPRPMPFDRPAILYIHGGAYINGSVAQFRREAIRYAWDSQTTVFAVEYRLAPKHPYPKPLQDVLGALTFIRQNKNMLGIDPARVGLLGIGAGGGLALSVALLLQCWHMTDRISRLVLVAPMLDDRTHELDEEDRCMGKMLTWTPEMNALAWDAYVGQIRARNGEVNEFAAPGRSTDLVGLPRTYIDVGEFDLFREECARFAERLGEARGEVEFHVYKGVPHASDWTAPSAQITEEAMANRLRVLRDL
ncbi:Alpha/Beta hydrolase protein [Chaetomium sp. MPI-CAGE-AT-0009]|nr:Alpha/Beta hydrolase protein [Chaetomium sp. MPI-CAGE-AT-0009]